MCIHPFLRFFLGVEKMVNGIMYLICGVSQTINYLITLFKSQVSKVMTLLPIVLKVLSLNAQNMSRLVRKFINIPITFLPGRKFTLFIIMVGSICNILTLKLQHLSCR